MLADPWRLVSMLLVLEGAILAVSLVLVFGHGWRARWRERRWSGRVEQGRQALRDVVRRGRADRTGASVLAALPPRMQVRLFTELAPSLTGQSRRQLAALAAETGLMARAERMTSGRRWRDRLHGIRLLGALGAGERAVLPRLDDPNRAVRAEAVEWAGSNPTPALVDRLVALLARSDRYDSFVVRDALLRVGPEAVEPLVRHLGGLSGAAALPPLEVAAGLADPRFGPAARRLAADPLGAVRARAAALAGAVGTAEDARALQTLLADPDAEVRAAAAAALGRLGHWPAAAAIAPLLRDPAWPVRRESALALRSLGSPGLLYLRRGLDDADRFAADIARQVLDLPEPAAERERWT